ncbi:MAG: NAD(P)H-dependent oxidoreductase [Burkholderiales bacterium]|jgi:flavodoxin|nr:NAD(P)H-dependent oxidoreductase [Burkholderiales bacterium]
MAKILIAYHTRTAYTRRVAEAIARRVDADLDEIGVTRERPGPIGYARCALEAMAELPASIRMPEHDAADYDLVVIGTPVWFWSLSSPVRAYVLEERRRFKRVAFFCTMGGSGAERVFADLAKLCSQTPVATLSVTDAEIDSGYLKKLEGFVRALKGAAPRAAARRRAR